jgi:aspartyl/asparaginyl-tRNA synthetase
MAQIGMVIPVGFFIGFNRFCAASFQASNIELVLINTL